MYRRTDARVRVTTAAALGAAALLILGGCTSTGSADASDTNAAPTTGMGASVVPRTDAPMPTDSSDSDTAGSHAAGSDTAGSNTADSHGADTPGSDVAGSDTAGSDTAGPSAGADAGTWNSALQAAAETAIGHGPDGGTLTSIESENDATQWEVKIVAKDGVKHKFVISRDGADVVTSKQESTSESDRAKYRERIAAAKLDYADAIDALLDKIPDGRIDELQLDTSDVGAVVWEADIYGSDGAKQELDVDAASGIVSAG